MEEIISLALNYGLIPAMFVGLMIYVLKDSKKRETKYQETNEKLASALEIVKKIHEDIKDMKEEKKRS